MVKIDKTGVVSLRLHKAIIKEVDRIAKESGQNRAEFLQTAVQFFIGYWRNHLDKKRLNR